MRIISQDGMTDLPYDKCMLNIEKAFGVKFVIEVYSKIFSDIKTIIAVYSTEEKAVKAMELLRSTYAGEFMYGADIENMTLPDVLKGCSGSVVISNKNTDTSVMATNCERYFRFPQDDEV